MAGHCGSIRLSALQLLPVYRGSPTRARPAVRSARSTYARSTAGRLDIEPYPVGVMSAVLAQQAVRKARNVDGGAALNSAAAKVVPTRTVAGGDA